MFYTCMSNSCVQCCFYTLAGPPAVLRSLACMCVYIIIMFVHTTMLIHCKKVHVVLEVLELEMQNISSSWSMYTHDYCNRNKLCKVDDSCICNVN